MTEMTHTEKASEEKATLEKKASPKLFQGSGRIGRVYFLLFFCLTSLIPGAAILITIFMSLLLQSGATAVLLSLLAFLAGLFSLVINIIICIRRLNDLDAKGWWVLAIIIPIVNFILLAVLLFYPGTKGANSYGEQPPSSSKDTLAAIIVLSVITGLLLSVGISQLETAATYY